MNYTTLEISRGTIKKALDVRSFVTPNPRLNQASSFKPGFPKRTAVTPAGNCGTVLTGVAYNISKVPPAKVLLAYCSSPMLC